MQNNGVTTTIETFELPKGMLVLDGPAQLLMEIMGEVHKSPAKIDAAKAMCEVADKLVKIASVQVDQGRLVVDMVRINKGI